MFIFVIIFMIMIAEIFLSVFNMTMNGNIRVG